MIQNVAESNDADIGEHLAALTAAAEGSVLGEAHRHPGGVDRVRLGGARVAPGAVDRKSVV